MSLTPFWSQRVLDRAVEVYGTTHKDILGTSRFREHVMPRFAIAYTFHFFGMGVSEIGRKLGGRDHSTVINALEKAEIHVKFTPGFSEIIGELVDAASPGASASLTWGHAA